jgi:16S rRNA (uracil1498-N3)-methyltransferase
LLQSLKNEPNFSELFLAIGPEGGFSSEEIQQLERAGFESALLSENILRGETAAISAAAIAIHAIAF